MADSSTTTQKVSAEMIGTFVLVFFGCGAAIFSRGDYVATALAFGLTVLVGAYAFGRISGAHFNPAVSVGAALGGRMAWSQAVVYIAAQLVGGLVGGAVLFVLVHGLPGYDVGRDGLAQNSFGDQGDGIAWWAALLIELIMTAVFVWVILAVTDARNTHPAMAPMTIGLALAMIHFASIGATGTSVNPARSIGVGVFAGTDAILQLWLFILAPLAGGAIAGLTYPLVFGRDTDPVPGSGFAFGSRGQVAVTGYALPDQFQQEWNQQALATEAAAEQAWAAEPIIQDGWQWDHQAQEWKPLEQWQPAGPVGDELAATPAPTPTPAPGASSMPAAENTQIAAPPVTDSPYSPGQPDQPGAPGNPGQQP